MTISGPDTGAADDPTATDLLAQALQAWTAAPLPDDGFTAAVLQRIAHLRQRSGLAPAEALQRLRSAQQREARQARWTGLGLLLGLAMAVGWLLAGTPWSLEAAGPGPWPLWLGAGFAGASGALAWLAQQVE